jgi:hypothetical protein
MQVTVIEIGGQARYVVRPVDNKALNRFLTKARTWLLKDQPDAALSHRTADQSESDRWKAAFDLHCIWGGDEDEFFGIPL